MNEETVLHAMPYIKEIVDDTVFLLAPSVPNWIATDERGAKILSFVDGRRTAGRITDRYCRDMSIDRTRGWLHVHTFLKDALRHQFVSPNPVTPQVYKGRAAYLEPTALRELWIHTNNSCNLACTHCLVRSGPNGDAGPETRKILKWIDEGLALGVERFYFTGGEPMARKDFWELVEYVTSLAEMAVLTNGTLISGERLERLRQCDPNLLKLQISLDGSTPETNDPIRGPGSFRRAVEGIRNAVSAGFYPTLTTVVTRQNVDDLSGIVRLAADLRLTAVHFMWMHLKGRAAENNQMAAGILEMIEAVEKARRTAAELGVYVDNIEAAKTRMGGPAGLKMDLSNAAWESLCIYSDGGVYPSAATVQVAELRLGDANRASLKEIWLTSPVARKMREASVEQMDQCRGCRYKFLCGGGDIEHRYFFGRNGHADSRRNGTAFIGDDPYCGLYQSLIGTAMREMARRGDQRNGPKTGFDAPTVFAGMGDVRTHDFGLRNGHAAEPADKIRVAVKHSNCVLAFDLDTYRRPVREFYGEAAEKPQADLCCPIKYNSEFLDHIPKEAIEVFYGCGGPMQEADIREGQTVVDLGSGGGIDCFIAAKRVGPAGRVIGVDMTDKMLNLAGQNRVKVAANLGYDNVEFRKGFLESVPVDDKSADLVTSNCVVNLSPDKRKVFREIWRILKDTGTVLISDIVTERELPLHLAVNNRLVGECIGQALTEEQFLAYLEQAGFYGITVTKKFFWKDVEGHPVYSITVRGQKFEKTKGCVFIGQQAIYHGPFKSVTDEEGHLFPRNEPVEICTDTAAKLSAPPYNAFFTVTSPDGKVESACCLAGTDGKSCC
ncbi:MAG: hypothetical protein A3G34_12415 [Candidatus Lindowbacteria bacterium RIFCSPLOWO2_12_FULL_62_27]|nr:MAG: hypothetical protein A3G34_12415 [Candidatus Lindowbacteria bacterium RIFCSPLOWO2_12_FULL_62_27]